jgi:hypothetical protein
MLFDWISESWGDLELRGLEVEAVAPPTDTEGIAESEFEMEFDEGSGVLAWQYDTTLYGEARVGVMADTLDRVLAHCAVSGRFHLGFGPYWLRFTYATPVLATKY